MKNDSIGTALIGRGYWGAILKKYLNEDSRFSLLHLAGRDYPLKKIWDDKKVDLVIIATPNNTHSFLVTEALKNGKNVVVEKPLSLKVDDSQKIMKLSEKMHKFVMTDYTQTFSQGLNYLVRQKTKLGKILYYEMRVGKIEKLKNDLSADVYWHLMSHLLSVLDMFESIDNFTFRKQTLIEDKTKISSSGVLAFEKGFLRVSVDYPFREFIVVLYGKKGVATYSAFSDPTVVINERSRSFNERDNLRLMLDCVWKVFHSREKSNLDMAMRVTKVLSSF